MSRYSELLEMIESPGEDCIVWPYSTNGRGYGEIRIGGKKKYAHRLALETVAMEPTVKHQAAHGECHNPSCVNPRHLSWKTHAENQQDKVRDGTTNHGHTWSQGEAHGEAKLTSRDVEEIRRLYVVGNHTMRQLASIYNVSVSLISKIHTRKLWKHV